MAALGMVLWGLFSPAQAFCGTYVGSAGSELANRSSRVVLVREGSQTVLNLAMDYEGDAADFALLLPVPEVLDPAQVQQADAAAMTLIEQYGTPRAVRYTCEDVFTHERPDEGLGLGCATDFKLTALGEGDSFGYGMGDAADSSVTVEAEFALLEYEFVVLSAEESGDLLGWLEENGYALPAGGAAVLQEYIDAGSYFLAAKIDLEEVPAGQTWLTPLQIRYEADVFALPIRIGTISAKDEQEVIVSVIARAEAGEVGISNYPELEIEDECMWPEGMADFSAFYEEKIQAAYEERGAGWVKEYSWDLWTKCDPCTTQQSISDVELIALGVADINTIQNGTHLTRLRMRYRPDQATQDLSFYFSGIEGVSSQMRFIERNEEMEFLYPTCGEGFPEDPGQCPSDSLFNRGTSGSGLPPLAGLGALTALAAWRRRR